jgi:hypothetical protein
MSPLYYYTLNTLVITDTISFGGCHFTPRMIVGGITDMLLCDAGGVLWLEQTSGTRAWAML